MKDHYKQCRKFLSFFSVRVRKRTFKLFIDSLRPKKEDLILDVGITSDIVHDGDNYFENYYPFSKRIVAVGIENLSLLKQRSKTMMLVQADGKKLPFKDKSFDIVFSSAVLEHVGSRENQKKFISEILRVGKRFFVTTPNRKFPIEVHSGLPLFHLLPCKIYRRILLALKLDFFASENNLNLFDKKDLKKTIANNEDLKIKSVKFLFFPLNLIIIKK